MTNDGALFAHGGEMGDRMLAIDWSSTPLGPVEAWPSSLKTCIRIVLTSRQPMFVWWGEHLINLYNDAYKAILGGKHPEALGQPASVVWREIWAEIAPRAASAIRANEGTYDEALLLIMERNGYPEETYYTFSYSPVPDEQGGSGGILCANTDDTLRIVGARQMATLRELAARTVDARTRELAGARSADVLATNPRDVPFSLLYLYDAERRVFTLAGASGLGPGDRAAPLEVALDASDGVWPLTEVLRAHEPRVLTGLEGMPSGAWERPATVAAAIPLEAPGEKGRAGVLIVGLSPFRKLDDNYRGFIDLMARQIAASIANADAYEQETRRAAALAAIDRAKTAFFSNISHEFRTPLTLMIGPTQDALGSPEGLRGQDLEMVHRNELRLLRLVNTLLDFSRIEAGREAASFEPTDLAALTTDLASAFRSAIEHGGLSFDVDCPPLEKPILIDRAMWEKIVLNLLSNALKFTFEGAIAIALHEAGDTVELSVRDTGVGIPEQELGRVFERFHRIEGMRSRTHEGSGIGLALVNDLVRLHGGDIRVESAVGRGTTFTVSIPARTASAPVTVDTSARPAHDNARADAFVEEALRWLPARAPNSSSGATRASDAGEPTPGRVLVVDDNADMRDYVARLLRQHWAVTTATNGAEALETARRDPPDLVLTDVMMPIMDGFHLVRELRADARTATVPILVLSARAGEEEAAEGLRVGADDYLMKPFSASALVVRVESLLASARVRAEARAAAELDRRRLYQLFMEGPAALCLVRGDDLVIDLANRNILDLWGKPETVIGRPLLDAVPELRGQGFDERLREVMRTGVAYRADAALARLDRSRAGALEDVYVDLVFSPVREPVSDLDHASHDASRPTGVLVFASDVTEQVCARRAAESARVEAEQARREAEAANRAKDEFLAMLGHELRNPLAPIVTALELMRFHDPENDDAARIVIERQVDHLVRLIDDLLDVARIARGKVELHKEHLETATVVARAVEMASPLFEQFEQTLTVEVPRHGLMVDGDRTRLAQVVANLLTNAAKYSERGAAITIRASRDANEVVLDVIDAGVGIAPDMLPSIFDLFMQVPQTIARSRGGLGLGLALVRNFVAAHGGSVSARSAGEGQGSVFTVRLPLVDVPAPAPAIQPEPLPRAPVDPDALRILVVDDNTDAAAIVAIHLRKLGHTIHVAHDGLSALRAANELRPDVALVDIGLPVMDGYELARRLRSMPGLEQLRLVAVTGYGQDTDRAQSLDAGFDVHLVKPVQRARFAAVLDQFVAERRGSRAEEVPSSS